MTNTQHDESTEEQRLRLLLSRSPTRQRLVSLMLKGMSRKAIAAEMGRSPHTIDAHLKVMYRTLGFGDRARLMLIALSILESTPPRNRGVDE